MEADVINVEFALHWRCRLAAHCDRRVLAGVLPARQRVGTVSLSALAARRAGDCARLVEGAVLIPHDPAFCRQTSLQGWRHDAALLGRHYPRSLLPAFPRHDLRPFRVLAVEAQRVLADFNPPLAGIACTLDAQVLPDMQATAARTAAIDADLTARLTDNGPGMQAALAAGDTDFPASEPMARDDDRDDALFYQSPRRVDHLDAPARAALTALYRRMLRPGMRVLDLMASWHSHLPDDIPLVVHGLGMNGDELDDNAKLTAHVVHDLNRAPMLPYPDRHFDAVLCALSIEYLVRPLAVAREVARVLVPGGTCVIAFSDRWFPSKAIRLWRELHAFERMGFVVDLLHRADAFEAFATESLSGLPAPSATHHRPHADPLFVVSARRRGGP